MPRSYSRLPSSILSPNNDSLPGPVLHGRPHFKDDFDAIRPNHGGQTLSSPLFFAVSLYAGKTDIQPASATWSLDELRAKLSSFDVRESKDGPLWSPASIAPGKTRSNDNVDDLSCLVLDFDAGEHWDDFLDGWAGLTVAIYTTFQHTDAAPHWRAVFPLSESVPAPEWPSRYASLSIGLARGLTDPACKDASRMYYLPTRHPERDGFVHWQEGSLLDPNAYPAVAIDHYDSPLPVYEPAVPQASGKPGDDFDARATWEEILQPHGWQLVRSYGSMTLWTRPGKRRSDGVSARTGVGSEGDRFYCWSSNAGVPQGRLFKKYALYAQLDHGGDYSAAARALAKRGFGTQPAMPATEGAGAVPRSKSHSGSLPGAPEDLSDAELDLYDDPFTGERRPFDIGDVGNAERFITWYGRDLRYVAETGWHVWDGEVWRKDEAGIVAVKRLAMCVARRVAESAWRTENEKQQKERLAIAGKLLQKKHIDAMISLAANFPQIEARAMDFDSNPLLLGCRNGTLDLRTGILKPAVAADMITMRTGCDYQPGECPLFLKFYEETMLGREDLMRFVLWSIGYTLSGETKVHAFWFLNGAGRNGKSVLMELLRTIMGDYATTLQPESIMVRRQEQIPADLATLFGKRMVLIEEVDDEKRLNTGLIKALSAFVNIKARFLNKNFFEFDNKAKTWITGNERPQIKNFGPALERRLKVVPFENKITDETEDQDLPEKLQKEAPAILWLFVQAYQQLAASGFDLTPPESVIEATKEYKDESDYVGSFLSDMCDLSDKFARLAKKALRNKYLEWCKSEHISPLGRDRFYGKVVDHGVPIATTMTHGDYPFEGIRFKGELDYED